MINEEINKIFDLTFNLSNHFIEEYQEFLNINQLKLFIKKEFFFLNNSEIFLLELSKINFNNYNKFLEYYFIYLFNKIYFINLKNFKEIFIFLKYLKKFLNFSLKFENIIFEQFYLFLTLINNEKEFQIINLNFKLFSFLIKFFK